MGDSHDHNQRLLDLERRVAALEDADRKAHAEFMGGVADPKPWQQPSHTGEDPEPFDTNARPAT